MTYQVVQNEAEEQFELHTTDGAYVGFAAYQDQAGTRDFNHTVIFPEFRGQGASKALIGPAIEATRAQGLEIQASCSAVANWLAQHQS